MGLKRLLLLLAGNIHCGRAFAYTHPNTNTNADANTHRHAYSHSDTHACTDTLRHQRCEPHHLYAAGKSHF